LIYGISHVTNQVLSIQYYDKVNQQPYQSLFLIKCIVIVHLSIWIFHFPWTRNIFVGEIPETRLYTRQFIHSVQLTFVRLFVLSSTMTNHGISSDGLVRVDSTLQSFQKFRLGNISVFIFVWIPSIMYFGRPSPFPHPLHIHIPTYI